MSLDKVLNYFLTQYVKHSKILHILMISYRINLWEKLFILTSNPDMIH